MITIDEAIKHCEEIAEKCDLTSEASKTIKANRSYRKCAEEHRQLADWLRGLQRYQWIPISERLPHDGENILACYDDGYMLAIQFYVGARFSFIAWMPLPMPYEPKGDDNEYDK